MDASGRQCVICDMIPVFSDVSHLLTHLLSKGHLSQKNKLEFRMKGDDPAATALLTAYEDWYSANNLDPLLAERQAAKDGRGKRRSSGQNALIQNTLIPPVLTDPGLVAATQNLGVAATSTPGRTVDGDASAPGTVTVTPAGVAASTPIATASTIPFTTASPAIGDTVLHTFAPTVATATLPDYIDPRLGEPFGGFKDESDSNSASLVPSTVDSRLGGLGSFNDGSDTKGASSASSSVGCCPAQLTPKDSDACNAYTSGNTELTSWDGEEDIVNQDENQIATLPVTPLRNVTSRKNQTNNSSSLSTNGASDPFYGDEKQTNDNVRSEETIRLKGVLWPGMGLFDAATPEMRRMRNQKKDGTLLKQLETTSQQVEPAELIFKSTKGFPFQVEREITGKVEDYPPLEGETPIAKKGPHHGKPAMLRERDANIPRARDTKRVKSENPRSEDQEGLLRNTEPAGMLVQQGPFGSAYDEADEDLALGVRRPRFPVFNDAQVPGHAESPMIQVQATMPDWATMQAPRGTLAPAQLALNDTSNISHNHGHRIPPNNENIHPMLNIGAGGESETWIPTMQFNTNFVDGTGSTNVSDGTGYFYGDPTFGQGTVVASCYGFQPNPFYGATSETTMFGHQSYNNEEVTPTNGGWTNNSQAMASGTGTFEGDHHQLNQMPHMNGYQY